MKPISTEENKTRIMFFIGGLGIGGKERRLVELLTFLEARQCFELLLVMTKTEIEFSAFHELNVPVEYIEKGSLKNDLAVFYKLYKISLRYKPHIIHSWGAVQSFYLLPTIIFQNIPLINGQITDASPKSQQFITQRLINRVNFHFSKIILSNSKAGLAAYGAPVQKSMVIYNGVNLNRFKKLSDITKIKRLYQLNTGLVVVMVASFSPNKDYDYFYRIATLVTEINPDVTFIGVGSFEFNGTSYHRLKQQNDNARIIFHDVVQDVESLVNACDVGVLFSNSSIHGEGISNSIMEYMSLSKPVVANDAGGTREILHNGINGYLLRGHSDIEVRDLFLDLLNNKERRESLGRKGREIIEQDFSLHNMGLKFIEVYQQVLNGRY